MANCKSCGAEILWVKSENMKNMPIDAKYENRLVLTDQGPVGTNSGTNLKAGEHLVIASVVKTYVSHFATCPEAEQHRKSRGPNAQNSREPEPTS